MAGGAPSHVGMRRRDRTPRKLVAVIGAEVGAGEPDADADDDLDGEADPLAGDRLAQAVRNAAQERRRSARSARGTPGRGCIRVQARRNGANLSAYGVPGARHGSIPARDAATGAVLTACGTRPRPWSRPERASRRA